MSLRARSHSDLHTAGTMSPLDDGLYKSISSSSLTRGGAGGAGGGGGGGGGVGMRSDSFQGTKAPCRPSRRPVRAVRPVSAVSSTGCYQVNHLQGELVRKRKECEDLRKENKFLSNEIHMERVVMRSENELTMRNLRNLNQELQAQVKELKQKLYLSQQRAALCSRAADQAEEARRGAEEARRGAEQGRALAQARALGCQRDRGAAEAERSRLGEELQLLKKELSDLQLSLAQTEKNYLEAKLKLERLLGEKEVLLQESRNLEGEREELRHKLRLSSEENARIKESEEKTRRRAAAAEHEANEASEAQREAEGERRRAERENQERASECRGWRERHQQLEDRVRIQDELKAMRQNKACQANIKSYFLCMTESDQRVKILRNQDGSPRNFTEGDPVYISTSDSSPEEPERSSSRTMLRVSAPQTGRDPGPSHFDELPAFGGERPDSAPQRRTRKVVDYFWIPTDQD